MSDTFKYIIIHMYIEKYPLGIEHIGNFARVQID